MSEPEHQLSMLFDLIRADATDESSRLIAADLIDEHFPDLPPAAAGALRRNRAPLMTVDRTAATCLAGCRYPVASFAKRFARDVCEPITWGPSHEMASLTPKQYACMWRLVWTYRKQIAKFAAVAAVVETAGRVKAIRDRMEMARRKREAEEQEKRIRETMVVEVAALERIISGGPKR